MKTLSPLATSIYNKEGYLLSRIPELEREIIELKKDYESVKSDNAKKAIDFTIKGIENMVSRMKLNAV